MDGSSTVMPILLGVAGERFSFLRDSPGAVSWCSCVSLGRSEGEPGIAEPAAAGHIDAAAGEAMVDDVQAFIVDVVGRRGGSRGASKR